jgi:isopenicillin-N epimerase
MTSLNPPMPLRPGLRSEWLLDERIAFLNHGSFGAVPRVVFDEQTAWRLRIEAEPIEYLGRRAQELVAAAKQPLGEWLGMAGEDFGLVTNATEGINAVLQSLDLRAGDELLSATHVYNAVRQSMRVIADRRGATCREIALPVPLASAEQILERVVGGLSPRTRLLLIDHATSPTALVFPVQAIAAACADRGVDVLVDGAHAPGMLPLNVPGVGAAYYTGNLHKWPCAPKGCAFLWVRPDRQAGIHPLAVSHHRGEGLAREFAWQGTRDFSAWLAMPRALAFMSDLGWDRVREHNHAMAVWFQQMLCRRWDVQAISPPDGSMIGSMAAIPLPAPLDRLTVPQAAALQQRLYRDLRIEAPIMLWNERAFVRPCCQVYNTAAEYERLGDAVLRL